MASELQPIKLWGHGGPNPPKVAIILEELGLPYEIVAVQLAEVKQPAYLALNPNGRLPTIQDPNFGITLWESGAIVDYLIDRYDTSNKLSFPRGTIESYHAKQWTVFQQSDQAPYFGQAGWFKKFHAERIPSAIERYVNEVNRISGVLEGWLTKREEEGNAGSDGPWLVGDKCSYADLAFVQWQRVIGMVLDKEEYSLDKFPHLNDWMDKLCARKLTSIALEKTSLPA